MVSLWQPDSRIGAELVNDIGALCWNELATTESPRGRCAVIADPQNAVFAVLEGETDP